MTKSRKEILEINPAFTKFILDMQLSYKPEPFEEGDRVDSFLFNLVGDKEGTAILTKKLADKLTREQNEEFEKNRDENPFTNTGKLEFIESLLVVSSKQNSADYFIDLSHLLESIRIELKETDLMILGVENTPWLYQKNNYFPVKNALEYLKQRVEKDFNGGFLLKEDGIFEFIPHLFWLTRCNASLPYFYMSFPNSKTVFSICKYGVMHFEFYDQNEKMKILNLLSKMNFKEIDNCGDPIEFDSFNGRKIKISS